MYFVHAMKGVIVIFKKLICLMLFLAIMLLAGCVDKEIPAPVPDASSPKSTINDKSVSTPTGLPTDGDTLENNLVGLLKHDDLKVSEELISQFYKYYCTNDCELSLLPAFNSPDEAAADWDQFSLYIWRNFVHPKIDGRYNNLENPLTKEKFAETVNRYFGQIDYIDRSSSYLIYENNVYTREPGDETGGVYYRLTDIHKDDGNVYTAVFDALHIEESDYMMPYEEATPNIKAIRDAAGTKEYLHFREEFEQALLDIFLKPNYNQVLEIAERVEIRFILSGDEDFPLIYKSCSKTEY